MTEPNEDHVADAVALLEDLPDYKILTRVEELKPLEPALFTAVSRDFKLGILLDTETTGLDLEKDDIIELGMLPFLYISEGKIIGTLLAFSKLRQPSVPITEEITKITGIYPDEVIGRVITLEEVESFLHHATIIIAHHADFDRPRVEKIWPIFKEKHWACSMNEIDWKSYGFEGRGLKTLLMQNGMFFDGHRAIADCHALLALLNCTSPDPEPHTFLSALLENARKSTWRIDAVDSPYAVKDKLKQRKYRWDSDLKSWWKEVTAEEGEAECAWLVNDIYGSSTSKIKITKTTARDRFTERAKPTSEPPEKPL